MGKYGEKTTIQEGKGFLNLFKRLRVIGSELNIEFSALIKKILSDFADSYERKKNTDEQQ